MANGPVPAAIVPNACNCPEFAWIAYMVTSLETLFATYANRSDGSTATASGSLPAAMVPIVVRVPVVGATVNIPTLLAPWLATNTNLPSGAAATDRGSDAGTVPIELNAPVFGSTLYIV